ncbi:hypothetical protein PMAYCL1PPCAC_16150, partial [Pristionchus mayeri]
RRRSTRSRSQHRAKQSSRRMQCIRHILLVLIIVVAWLLGSLMFWLIEAPAEKEAVAETYVNLNEAFEEIAKDLLTQDLPANETEIVVLVKQAYTKLLKIEGK